MQKSNWIGSINYGFISICVVVGSTSSSSHLLLAVLHPSNLLAAHIPPDQKQMLENLYHSHRCQTWRPTSRTSRDF
jgi:hypothetical protein